MSQGNPEGPSEERQANSTRSSVPDGGGARGKVADVAKPRRAEDDLAMQARVLESMSEGVSLADEDGFIVYTNPAEDQIFGYEPGEMIGQHVTIQNAYPPEENARLVATVMAQLKENGSWAGEWRNKKKDGTPFWTYARITALGRGGKRYWVCVQEDITDRRQAEEALRESEEQYRAVYSQAASGIAEVDMDGRFTRANDRYCEVVGYPREELLGLRFQDITHPDDLPASLALFGRIAEGPDRYTIEKRYVRKDGRDVWCRTAVSLIRDASGRPSRVLAIVDDVTERMHAEAASRESEGRFRLLAEVMPQIVWTADPDGSVDYFNSRWYEYTGLTPESSPFGDEWKAVVHPEDLVRLSGPRDLAVGRGERFEGEYRLRDRTGAYRWHLIRSVPVRDEGGRVLRRFGTSTDIHDRKRSEQDARFLAEAGAALASHADEAAALREVARLAVPHFADWCAVDLLGEGGSLRRVAFAHVDPTEVDLGEELNRRYPPDPQCPLGTAGVVRSGRPAIVTEVTDEMLVAAALDAEHLRILRELGLRSYLCVPLAGREGILGALTFVAAESDRRYEPRDLRLAEDLAYRAAIAIENARLYEALREGDRRKDEFLATLAHELRNPLAPIRNALHLLKYAGGDAHEREAERAMAERQVAHLARLVDDLMDIARITRGKIELRKEVVGLAAIVERAIEAVGSSLQERGHALSSSIADTSILLEADPTRLEQVLWNLLNNAIKYTEPGGLIRLEAGRVGGEAFVRVRDTGIGIMPEMLPHIFQMFVQAEHRSDRSKGGLGIGLCLVKTLVEMHGGTISVRSEGAGRGTEFTLRLPALPPLLSSPADSSPTDGAQESEVKPTPRGHRILVVDDNVDAARSLARVLARLYGQEVEVAHDGPTALSVALAFRPEVVLLDIGMPVMDGYEVARRLRSHHEPATMRLIALTGWGQEADRQRSKDAGIDDHLVKPVDPEVIMKIILPRNEQ